GFPILEANLKYVSRDYGRTPKRSRAVERGSQSVEYSNELDHTNPIREGRQPSVVPITSLPSAETMGGSPTPTTSMSRASTSAAIGDASTKSSATSKRVPKKNQQSPERKNVPFNQMHFDRIPVLYDQILPYLIQKGLVEPRPLPPIKQPYSPGFDINVRCDYHAGSPGHSVEDCRAFKYKVQELIDRKLLSFKKESRS
ncbi:gag-pol polyprotein, partial [Trifolium pratense]